MSSKFPLQALADCVANWDGGVMGRNRVFFGRPARELLLQNLSAHC